MNNAERLAMRNAHRKFTIIGTDINLTKALGAVGIMEDMVEGSEAFKDGTVAINVEVDRTQMMNLKAYAQLVRDREESIVVIAGWN